MEGFTMTILKYDFKKFFGQKNPMHNNEYVTNGHLMIKKSVLRKSQIEFINTYEQDEKTINNLVNGVIKPIFDKTTIAEFIPSLIGKNTIDRIYNGLYMEYNNKEYCVIEVYYNFIKNLKCTLNITDSDGNFSPLIILDTEGEKVGGASTCKARANKTNWN